MKTTTTSHYGQFCRPNLHEQLQSLSLDIDYYKGDGNYLYYNKNGRETRVLDFLGGFGTLIFGHNNKALTAVIKASLDNNVPFATQGSNRVEAGRLAFELNRILKQKLQEDYLAVFSNSGTEAIEVCIKHCLYTHYNAKKKKRDQVITLLKRLQGRYGNDLSADASVIALLEKFYPGKLIDNNLDTIAHYIKNINETIFERQPSLIALKKAFHGKTIGAIQLTYNEDYKKELSGIGPKIIHIGQFKEELLTAIKDNAAWFYSLAVENKCLKLVTLPFTLVAGFIVEPIQGEGGMHVIDNEFLHDANATCKHNNIPVVFDEIQTGMGRTGKFLFAEQVGLTPDYITLSKGLGGGLTKIGATLIPRRIFGESFDKIHSSTFAEDDLSAVVARRCIALIEEDDNFYKNINDRSEQIINGIESIGRNYPGIIKEIRGKGLMLGLEFKSPAYSGSNCLRLLADQDMLGYIISGYLLHEFNIRTLPCLSDKQVIRIEPSAYTTEEECNYFLTAINRLCEILYKENMFQLIKFLVRKSDSCINHPITSYRKPAFEKQHAQKKVAFIGHFVKAADMADWEDSFEMFTEIELEEIIKIIYPFLSPFISDRKVIISSRGEKVQLDMMAFVITSGIITEHMRDNNLQPLLEKINKCIELAEENGCSMIGFGGFTSIITGNCKNITLDTAHYTTGNAFTAAMGLKAVFAEAPRLKICTEDATFAAVGAGGNIASVYSEFMAQKVKKLILIGSKGRLENIENLALKIFTAAVTNILKSTSGKFQGIERSIAKVLSNTKLEKSGHPGIIDYRKLYMEVSDGLKEEFPIMVTSDINIIREANLVLSATNAPHEIIFPEMIGEHATVICDIAVPADVAPSVRNMPNVKVIQGGIVRIPNNRDFKIPGIMLPKGTAYACMSETLLLGLEGVKKHYSYGNISIEQVKNIYDISKIHGFKLKHAKLERSY